MLTAEVQYRFMAEVRSYLGMESVSTKKNKIELEDFEVFPMYDKYLFSIVFQRVESNKLGETISEMEQDYLETLEVKINFFRIPGERGYDYKLEVAKDASGEPMEKIISRVKYNRKHKSKHGSKLPEVLQTPEDRADQAVSATDFDISDLFPEM